MSQRAIDIDDDDIGITYSGSWFRDHYGTYDTLGNFGAPFLNTLHGTNSSGSLSYQFTGSKVSVLNTNQFNNPTGLSVQCFIDGESVPVITSTVPENNLLLCTKDGLSNGPHLLTVNATVTNDETFWFDYLSYIPSASVPLDRATLSIDSTDSQVQLGFGTGWSAFSPGYQTRQTGSQFHFDFTGISLIYYGFYDPSLPWDTSLKTATYSIDGGTPIPFDTTVNAASTLTKPTGVAYNQVLFKTADYPPGPHTLEIIYQGGNSTTPLTYQFVVVRGTASSPVSNTLPGGSSTFNPSSTFPPSPTFDPGSTFHPSPSLNGATKPSNSSTNSAIPQAKKSSNTSVIVGAIVGVIALVALAVILFLYLRRRRQSVKNAEAKFRRAPQMTQSPPYAAVDSRAPNSSYTQPTVPILPSTQFGGSEDEWNKAPSTSSSNSARNGLIQLHPGGLTVVNASMKSLSRPTTPPPPLSRKGELSNARTTVVRDEDSGLRLGDQGDQGIVEVLPPLYTEG